MRIGFALDSLGRGGIERQIIELSTGLARRGHEVHVVSYSGAGSFDHLLAGTGVSHDVLSTRGKRDKVAQLRLWMEGTQPDIVHAAMKRASILSLLARPRGSASKVIATDFSTASYAPYKPALWVGLAAFARAEAVVTETVMNQTHLVKLAPWLKKKTHVIRNGVDLERFAPVERDRPTGEPFRLVAVGRLHPVKNAARVTEAVGLAREKSGEDIRLDWYGRYEDESGAPMPEYARAREVIGRHGLAEVVRFQGEVERVEDAYASAHAAIHASVQEGIPNAIVEAMASGLPIIASRIADMPLLLAEGQNGVLCDALEPASIADAICEMVAFPADERRAMGERSRDLALKSFGRGRYIDDYLRLYESIL